MGNLSAGQLRNMHQSIVEDIEAHKQSRDNLREAYRHNTGLYANCFSEGELQKRLEEVRENIDALYQKKVDFENRHNLDEYGKIMSP